MFNYYWKLPNGQIWGLAEAGWVTDPISLHISAVPDEEEIRARIRFYGGELGELATIEDLKPGDEYDFVNGQWVRHRFSKLAFFSLFTMTERMAIKAAIAGGNLLAAVIYDSLAMAEFIDVADPATAEALHGLAGEPGGRLLTPERAGEILAGVVHETAA